MSFLLALHRDSGRDADLFGRTGKTELALANESPDEKAVALAQVEEIQRRVGPGAQKDPGMGRADLAHPVPRVDNGGAIRRVDEIERGPCVERRVSGYRQRGR
jgi:hypothetical protein